MIKQYVFLLMLMFFLFSCKSKKRITHINEVEKTESAPPEDYFKIRDGFVLATVVDDFKGKGCPFLLKIEDRYYQVVDMDSSLNVNKLKIWIKFTPSKIVVKDCKIGVPIILNEVYVSEKQ
jgi:hypothetical protein